MDKLKEKTLRDYDYWDIKCRYIGSDKGKRLLKKAIRKIARKQLKEDLRKELNNNGI